MAAGQQQRDEAKARAEKVAEFLEAFARLTIRDRDRLLMDAKASREGRMPSSYQRMVAREEHARFPG